MCVVSMVGDHYRDIWDKQQIWDKLSSRPPAVTRAEFDELKRQVAEMVELLKRAKAYDERNNEPDCEIDEKMELLRKVAKIVGVDLDDALKPKKAPAKKRRAAKAARK